MITSYCWVMLLAMFILWRDPRDMPFGCKVVTTFIVLLASIASIVDVFSPLLR